MGGLSIWHLLILALLFVILFGKGKISDMMGDVAKGIKNFKEGMAEDEPAEPEQPAKPARKPRAKAAPKPRLAIEDKTEQKAATTTPRKRKTTTKS